MKTFSKHVLKSNSKLFGTLLFTLFLSRVCAQDFIIKNDGQKDSASITTFDIYSLKKVERASKDEDKKVIVFDTSSLKSFQICKQNFYLTPLKESIGFSHAFLPTDLQLQNVRFKSAQIDLSKYHNNGITLYAILLATNGYSEWMGPLNLGAGVAGYFIDKKHHKRSSEKAVLLMQKGNDTLRNLTSKQWLRRNNECWMYLQKCLSNDASVSAILNRYISKRKRPTYNNLRNILLAYIHEPSLQEIALGNRNFNYYKYRFLDVLSYPTSKLKESL